MDTFDLRTFGDVARAESDATTIINLTWHTRWNNRCAERERANAPWPEKD